MHITGERENHICQLMTKYEQRKYKKGRYISLYIDFRCDINYNWVMNSACNPNHFYHIDKNDIPPLS